MIFRFSVKIGNRLTHKCLICRYWKSLSWNNPLLFPWTLFNLNMIPYDKANMLIYRSEIITLRLSVFLLLDAVFLPDVHSSSLSFTSSVIPDATGPRTHPLSLVLSNCCIVLSCLLDYQISNVPLPSKQRSSNLWIMNVRRADIILLLIKKDTIKNASIRIVWLLITCCIINQDVCCSVIWIPEHWVINRLPHPWGGFDDLWNQLKLSIIYSTR